MSSHTEASGSPSVCPDSPPVSLRLPTELRDVAGAIIRRFLSQSSDHPGVSGSLMTDELPLNRSGVCTEAVAFFRGSPLIRRMWRQIAVTFGPVSKGRRVQMIEDTRRSRVLDKEEVACPALLPRWRVRWDTGWCPEEKPPFLLPPNNRK